MASYTSKGTMKIKDANGQMHPFYPETDYSYVSHGSYAVSETVNGIKSNIEKAESRNSIELMHIEPNDETAEDFQNETLIAWYGDPEHDSENHATITASTDAMSSPVKVVGDVVSLKAIFVNDGNEPFEDVVLTIPAFNDHSSAFNLPTDPFINETEIIEHVITEEDVLAALANEGNLAPQALTAASAGNGTIEITGDTETYLNVYATNLIKNKYDPFLSISRDSFYSANINEKPSYVCAVTNTTQTTINDVVLASSGTGWTETVSFEPGETQYFTIEYPVLTEAKIIELNGSLSDTFTANGISFASTPISVSKSISVNPKAPSPSLSIMFTNSDGDAASTIMQDIETGGTEEYNVVVTNTGNVTISSINVQITSTIGSDPQTTENVEIASLAPGESNSINRSAVIDPGIKTSSIAAKITSGTPAAKTLTLPSTVSLSIRQSTIFRFKATTYSNRISIPFNLYGHSSTCIMYVDWGDGSSSTLTPSSYSTYGYPDASVHSYANSGEYTISIGSENWESIYHYANNTYSGVGSISSSNATKHLYYYHNTVTDILTPLPKIAGTRYCTSSSYNYRYGTLNNSFAYLMYGCSKLKSIPSGLFDNNTAVTGFEYCLDNCSSLQSIPSGLFDNNTAATSFSYCFYGCSSLQSIPSGLFDNNTAATTFYSCFENCTSLQSIPAGLFTENTAATSFGYCFSRCSALNDFEIHIGSSKVSYAMYFITFKSGTARQIYVPTSSTTYTTFSNVASNLGLTVIGE